MARFRLGAVAFVVALLIGASGAPGVLAGSDTPAGPKTPGETWGWIVMREPSFSSSATFTPDPRDRGNSSGDTVTVQHPFLGVYAVRFVGIGGQEGVAQLSMLKSVHRTCQPQLPFEDAGDIIVQVHCFDDTPAANDADATFILAYHMTQDSGFPTAGLDYLWGSDESLDVTYDSEGGTNTVTRLDFGLYDVKLGKMGRFKGIFLASTPNKGVSCRVKRVFPSDHGPKDLRVQCDSLAGVGQDDPFSLTFLSGLGLRLQNEANEVYLLANKPTAASYVPAAGLRFSSAENAPPPTITRTGKGHYQVKLPRMPVGGAALVTAFSQTGRRCIVTSIQLETKPQVIGVRCMTLGGVNADTKFFFSHVR